MRYATIEKNIGETPLEAAERLRAQLGLPETTPLAYAGRLDPMATGKLLILIGDECKVQTKYHGLDKEYEVELLFGVRSDSGDVLGLTASCAQASVDTRSIKTVLHALTGKITLPYPHFSSKTVQGKPLHVWAVEKRLHEIEIPKKESTIYKLRFRSLQTISKADMLGRVREKIESIPPVTDPRKHLGADFRRTDVRAGWNTIESNGLDTYYVLRFTCTASSGTYMRSLAEELAQRLGSCGLALSIHRTKIGRYMPIFRTRGFWIRTF